MIVYQLPGDVGASGGSGGGTGFWIFVTLSLVFTPSSPTYEKTVCYWGKFITPLRVNCNEINEDLNLITYYPVCCDVDQVTCHVGQA